MKRNLTTLLFVLTSFVATAQTLPSRSEILKAMECANDYFIANYPDPGAPTFVKKYRPSNLWTRGVYFEGLSALMELEAGDTIVVSHYEGKRSFNLYFMAHGEKTILAYEDYLAEHEGNNTIGICVTVVFSLSSIALLIANTIHYKKTGRPLPLRGVRIRF